MSLKSDMGRLENIWNYISDIEKIIQKHGNIDLTLEDLEGQYALMMCLVQIGEYLNKIESPDLRQELPVKYAVSFRNILVHEYENIDMVIVKNIIEVNLPDLKSKIKQIINK
jgi:uncharacterized protein with HEPN domain